jgi:hypothetical protein
MYFLKHIDISSKYLAKFCDAKKARLMKRCLKSVQAEIIKTRKKIKPE